MHCKYCCWLGCFTKHGMNIWGQWKRPTLVALMWKENMPSTCIASLTFRITWSVENCATTSLHLSFATTENILYNLICCSLWHTRFEPCNTTTIDNCYAKHQQQHCCHRNDVKIATASLLCNGLNFLATPGLHNLVAIITSLEFEWTTAFKRTTL